MASLFSNWTPSALSVFKTVNFNDREMFRQMFNRLPRENENISELNQAGAVINMVFGLVDPPTELSEHECKRLLEAATAMTESDKSLSSAIGFTMLQIGSFNPQCTESWRTYLNK